MRDKFKHCEPFQRVPSSPDHPNGKYLEFSSLILDRLNRIAFASISSRCDPDVAKLWAKEMGYSLILFNSSFGGIFPMGN